MRLRSTLLLNIPLSTLFVQIDIAFFLSIAFYLSIIQNVSLQGYTGILHFIRFPSDQMDKFINMVVDKQFALLLDTFHATGGGAYKFDNLFQSEINIKFNKLDELDCLIKGNLKTVLKYLSFSINPRLST